MKTEDKIQKQLAENPIILYMKGVPANPQCGFSGKAVNLLNATNIPYAYVNVLEAPFIREKLPSISRWPTYPQLFVNGELIGGCDIIEELANKDSLVPTLAAALSVTETVSNDALTANEIKQRVNKGINDAKIMIEGAGCDLVITVISAQFSELTMVKKQQLVMATLTEPLASGKLHAVSVKAYTPEEWESLQIHKPSGLLQIQH